MHHDRHCSHHRREHHDRCRHCGQEGGRREDERSSYGHCCCCRGCCRPCGGGERGRGGRGFGREFDERRFIDTIVRLVTENVSREVEGIVQRALGRLRGEGGSSESGSSSCPECGK